MATGEPGWLYQVAATDNVATALGALPAGTVEVRGESSGASLDVPEAIPSGHKAALQPISKGEDIIKYAVRIGIATEAIPAGGWVHLHNVSSAHDERSSSLDPITGAPTDTEYA